jgi:hypothetical protein
VTLDTTPGKNDKPALDGKSAEKHDKTADKTAEKPADKATEKVTANAGDAATKPSDAVAKAGDGDKWSLVLNDGLPMMTSSAPAKARI